MDKMSEEKRNLESSLYLTYFLAYWCLRRTEKAVSMILTKVNYTWHYIRHSQTYTTACFRPYFIHTIILS